MALEYRDTGPFDGPTGWIAGIGLALITLLICVGLYVDIFLGRARLDLPAFAGALRQSGLSILPALSLVSIAVGLILGSQVESILVQLNLPGLVLVTMLYAVVMELTPILVGILVAGRAGVALAVRQATLTVTGEMDGLLASGVHPIRFTVGPVLLAMLVMSFAFAVWGTALTFAAAAAWAWATAGISPALFLEALGRALSVGALVEALVKPLLFALLIAAIATVNGTSAGRNPEGIAQAATRTMIAAVTAILVTDLLYILFVLG
jgi:phospholipid/cholesterol/gamma-HCH transport system permease protein